MPKPTAENNQAPRSNAGYLRQIGFLPLLALFYGYTAGGPFGYEEIFHSSGRAPKGGPGKGPQRLHQNGCFVAFFKARPQQ
jgi:hypothetical protein